MASTIWRGYITFGLISIPVRLFRAARAERVSFRRLYREEAPPPASAPEHRTNEPRLKLVSSKSKEVAQPEPILSPVQQASVREGSDEVLPAKSVVKGYEYEKNRFVEIDAEELKAAAAQTSSEMEIQEFVKLADIDPVYFETSYYVTPEEAGEKAYALLYRSMQTTGLVAIAQFAMHNREHVVVLRPGHKGMLAHTMFFSSEVRADDEYRAEIGAVTTKELDLAQSLIHSLAGPFEPEKYRDTYRERLEALIAAKVQGRATAPPKAAAREPKVLDMAEALRQSLANLKKPVSSEKPKKTSRSAGHR